MNSRIIASIVAISWETSKSITTSGLLATVLRHLTRRHGRIVGSHGRDVGGSERHQLVPRRRLDVAQPDGLHRDRLLEDVASEPGVAEPAAAGSSSITWVRRTFASSPSWYCLAVAINSKIAINSTVV